MDELAEMQNKVDDLTDFTSHLDKLVDHVDSFTTFADKMSKLENSLKLTIREELKVNDLKF